MSTKFKVGDKVKVLESYQRYPGYRLAGHALDYFKTLPVLTVMSIDDLPQDGCRVNAAISISEEIGWYIPNIYLELAKNKIFIRRRTQSA